MSVASGIELGYSYRARSGWTRFGVSSRLGDRSEVPGLDWAHGQKTIQGSPGPEIDIVSGIELGYSYELGRGWTRIGVMTRPRWGLGTVMTVPLSVQSDHSFLTRETRC